MKHFHMFHMRWMAVKFKENNFVWRDLAEPECASRANCSNLHVCMYVNFPVVSPAYLDYIRM